MSAERRVPRVGDLVVVHTPLCRVVELTPRDGVPGAVVTDDQLHGWVPLQWLVPVHLRDQNGGHR